MKTKQSLYDFIDNKVSAQRAELENQIDQMLLARVTPILDKWVQTSQLEKRSTELADSLHTALEIYPIMNTWDRKNIVSSINRYFGMFGQSIRDKVFSEMRQRVLDAGHYDFENEPLNGALAQLQAEAQPIRKKLYDLKKLHSELRHVIAKENNGDKGYKALVALGIDMKGYEEQNMNLPAITKLSVDPCLINGNCN